jgi:hypothetical protein
MYRHLVSTQCRKWLTLAQYERWAIPPQDPSRRFIAYRRGDRGYVAWVYPVGTLTPTAWPWVRENGEWKSDECPRSDPGS